jgi:catalase
LSGKAVSVDFSLLTVASVLFDAVYLPGGESSVAALSAETKAMEFVDEAYKHCKAIAATGAGVEFLKKTRAGSALLDDTRHSPGLIASRDAATNRVAAEFIKSIAQHRAWERELLG